MVILIYTWEQLFMLKYDMFARMQLTIRLDSQ